MDTHRPKPKKTGKASPDAEPEVPISRATVSREYFGDISTSDPAMIAANAEAITNALQREAVLGLMRARPAEGA